MKETFYFSHDYNARNDPKMQKVLMKLGQAGKGVFWDLIEMMYEQGGKLLLSECESYAFALRTELKTINSLIDDFGLFLKDKIHFWSETVLKRLKKRESFIESRARAGKASAKAKAERKNSTHVEQNSTHVEQNINTPSTELQHNSTSKVKESKVKENKDIFSRSSGKVSSIEIIRPTLQQISEFFSQNNLIVNPIKFFNYYEANGWMCGKNPVDNWKALAQNWNETEKEGGRNNKNGSGSVNYLSRAEKSNLALESSGETINKDDFKCFK